MNESYESDFYTYLDAPALQSCKHVTNFSDS